MTPKQIRTALDTLADKDPDIALGLGMVGYPAPRNREPGFTSLVNIIVGQQISALAAAAIRERLEAAVNPLTPDRFLATKEITLRELGLSHRKIEYGRDLAKEVLSGRLDTDRLEAMEDDEILKELTAIRGLGRWSAEIYMLFALGRHDIWPADDLAIQVAAQKLKRMRKRPDRARLERVARPWKPWRGMAALFLWHYHKGAP